MADIIKFGNANEGLELVETNDDLVEIMNGIYLDTNHTEQICFDDKKIHLIAG